MPNIETRPARAEDRDAVLAFCSATWEWGDYIENVWENWLRDPQGALWVATDTAKPVALSHMKMLSDTDAWLEGMRVDPAYRQQGIARAISRATMAEAMRRGAVRVRLITEATNIASITMVEHDFMRRVSAYAPHKAQPITLAAKQPSGLERPRLATLADLDEIIDYLNLSNNFPATGGLYYLSFTAFTIDQRLLHAKIEAGHVYLLRRWDRLDGLAIAEPHTFHRGSQLSIGYIDGTTESISMLAYALRLQAAAIKMEQVYAYVPDLVMVRDAFIGAEYTWDGHLFYTYERNLT